MSQFAGFSGQAHRIARSTRGETMTLHQAVGDTTSEVTGIRMRSSSERTDGAGEIEQFLDVQLSLTDGATVGDDDSITVGGNKYRVEKIVQHSGCYVVSLARRIKREDSREYRR